MTHGRTCPVCKEPLVQREKETNPRFRDRLYCCRACAGVARRGAVPHNAGANRACDMPPSKRTCPACTKLMVARPTESIDAFAKRTYCDAECARGWTRPVVRTLPERF